MVLPASLIGASFAIANRSLVSVSFDPTGLFPFLTTPEMPLFMVVLASMFVGILIGGAGTWLGGRKKKKASGVSVNAAARPQTSGSTTVPKPTLPVVVKPQAQKGTNRPALPSG